MPAATTATGGGKRSSDGLRYDRALENDGRLLMAQFAFDLTEEEEEEEEEETGGGKEDGHPKMNGNTQQQQQQKQQQATAMEVDGQRSEPEQPGKGDGGGGAHQKPAASKKRKLPASTPVIALPPEAIQTIAEVQRLQSDLRELRLNNHYSLAEVNEGYRAKLASSFVVMGKYNAAAKIIVNKIIEYREKVYELRRADSNQYTPEMAERWNMLNAQRTQFEAQRRCFQDKLTEVEKIVREDLPAVCLQIDAELQAQLQKYKEVMDEFDNLEAMIEEVSQAIRPRGQGNGGAAAAPPAAPTTTTANNGGSSSTTAQAPPAAAPCVVVANFQEEDNAASSSSALGGAGVPARRYPARPSLYNASTGMYGSPGGMGRTSTKGGAASSSSSSSYSSSSSDKSVPKPVPVGTSFQLKESDLPAPHTNDLPDKPTPPVIVTRRVRQPSPPGGPPGKIVIRLTLGDKMCRWKHPPRGDGMPTMVEVEQLLAQFDTAVEEPLLWAVYQEGWELESAAHNFRKRLSSQKPLVDLDENGDTIPPLESFSKTDAQLFEKAMQERWKDFHWAGRALRKKTKSCIAYYYNEWKKTDAYRRVKASRPAGPR